MPRKVLHLFGQLERGGAELRFLELLDRLPPGEFLVDVCALSGLEGRLDERVREHGGVVIPLALTAEFPFRFLSVLRDRKYHVVHSHVLHTSGPILMLAALARVPIRIAHFHATHDGRVGSLPRRVKRRILSGLIGRFATDIIACGEGSMDAMWHCDWRDDPRCRVVYDAVDPARFDEPVDVCDVRADLRVCNGGRVFVHVANVVAEKNHNRLIAIFDAIRTKAPESTLVLAGAETDDPDGQLAAAISERGLSESVRTLGVRDDIPRLLKATDVMLLPSIREGLPGVVLEACAAGLPVLGTDLPGVREIASRLDGVRYLPLSASDEEWADAALALAADSRYSNSREGAARRFRPSVFNIDRAVEAHRALWLGAESRSVECS